MGSLAATPAVQHASPPDSRYHRERAWLGRGLGTITMQFTGLKMKISSKLVATWPRTDSGKLRSTGRTGGEPSRASLWERGAGWGATATLSQGRDLTVSSAPSAP